MRERILGAILAGGRARRFGRDKALALLDGRPLIAHAEAAIAPFVDAVVLCGRKGTHLLGLDDRPAPDLGPLGGLNAALHHARDSNYVAVLSIGCDMPDLPALLVEALIGDGPAVIEGQHLAGYWPATLAARLDDHLARSDDRSIRGWLALANPRVVPAPELPNINRPEDLARLASARAAARHRPFR